LGAVVRQFTDYRQAQQRDEAVATAYPQKEKHRTKKVSDPALCYPKSVRFSSFKNDGISERGNPGRLGGRCFA
jgi:hypothetical protein